MSPEKQVVKYLFTALSLLGSLKHANWIFVKYLLIFPKKVSFSWEITPLLLGYSSYSIIKTKLLPETQNQFYIASWMFWSVLTFEIVKNQTGRNALFQLPYCLALRGYACMSLFISTQSSTQAVTVIKLKCYGENAFLLTQLLTVSERRIYSTTKSLTNSTWQKMRQNTCWASFIN